MQSIVDEGSRVLLVKDDKIKLALACILSDGHLLIEDLPGMGKTTLAHALAHVLGLSYQRVQFTSDMLPDRKSTRLNSSHVAISYAVFCLKKKKKQPARH